ncbi:alpha-L-fucosidase [Mangrovibacterium marinum]|uniref:alpha-L-fucosidase n=2 Tax=Mangrovibacterium marinum TaxID=1639118 RepID=A0A2T5BXX0_9BACT|nr:alpha-L-fucosidase [Mangrovibacterium marinum]
MFNRQKMKIRFSIALVLLLTTGLFAQAQLPKPTDLQMRWQKMETIAFVHFSINTFTDMEWGYGNESPELFNPTNLDCRQWVKICKDAGLKGVILTAKHHDGFCLWPSAYTEHSVKNSPWKNGQGDVVREFADACKEFGLKMGLYLSPWDCNHPDYGKPEYNQYFKNQLTELLTNYGDLFEIWFDGANGGRGYYGTDSLHNRSISEDYYDWQGFVDIVRELQPNCIVHGGGLPDIRWVGNEEGHAGKTHWSSLLPNGQFSKDKSHPAQLNEGHENGTRWLPSETDVSVRPGWYYHASEDHQVKSLPRLMDIYYESVGRNSLLLLNLSPDKRGLVHPIDSLRLLEWKRQLDQDFRENLITSACRFSSNVKKHVMKAFDDDYSSYWQASEAGSFLEIDIKKTVTINRLLLQEYIPEGQRVKAFRVEYFEDGSWRELASETTIGYKRILRFLPVTTSKLRVTFEEMLAPVMITKVAAYNAPILLAQPVIRRNQQGMVSIYSPEKHGEVFYTTDGTTPTRESNRYEKPFLSDGDVTIKAVVYSGSNHGELGEQYFGISKANWTVVGTDSSKLPLFDGNPNSSWVSPKNQREAIIDFGAELSFNGLTYLPDQARWAQGIASGYRISVSADGENWTVVLSGDFSNIRNNPITQTIELGKTVKARFLKFEATSVVDNQPVLGIAEINIAQTK